MEDKDIIKYAEEDLFKQLKSNITCVLKVLSGTKGKSLVESASDVIRSYDEALSKCLKAGAKIEDKDFLYDFTTNYTNIVLTLVANLLITKDVAKDENNLSFLKGKLKECILYIDKLTDINKK